MDTGVRLTHTALQLLTVIQAHVVTQHGKVVWDARQPDAAIRLPLGLGLVVGRRVVRAEDVKSLMLRVIARREDHVVGGYLAPIVEHNHVVVHPRDLAHDVLDMVCVERGKVSVLVDQAPAAERWSQLGSLRLAPSSQ